MALASRLLSISKQLCASQIILQQEYAIQVRCFAKGAAPAARAGDGIVVQSIRVRVCRIWDVVDVKASSSMGLDFVMVDDEVGILICISL